jgi:hypothetical protein
MNNGRPRKVRRIIEEDSQSEGSEAEGPCVEEAELPVNNSRVEAVRDGRGDPVPCDSNLRRWILVTLSHTEQKDVSLEEAVLRVERSFDCKWIVGAKERHEDGGDHYHIAIENRNASKKTATVRLRNAFSEFEGRGVNVRFHRSWGTMLQYTTKDCSDFNELKLFGITVGLVEQQLLAKRDKKNMAVAAVWAHVNDDRPVCELAWNGDVAPFMLTACSSVKSFARACIEGKKSRSSVEIIKERACDGDADKCAGKLSDQQKEALQEWVSQMQGRRPRQPQLYCVGKTGTGKTYLFQMLAEVTSCFVPCLENNDRAFAGYDDTLHDWILLNDFHDNVKFQTLSNLTEGCRMVLNGYGEQKEKKKNVPVVFTANRLPEYKNLDGERTEALRSRLKTVEFTTQYAWDAEPVVVEDLCAYLAKCFV